MTQVLNSNTSNLTIMGINYNNNLEKRVKETNLERAAIVVVVCVYYFSVCM